MTLDDWRNVFGWLLLHPTEEATRRNTILSPVQYWFMQLRTTRRSQMLFAAIG